MVFGWERTLMFLGITPLLVLLVTKEGSVNHYTTVMPHQFPRLTFRLQVPGIPRPAPRMSSPNSTLSIQATVPFNALAPR